MAKTTKTAAAASTAIKVTEFMKAWGGAQGDGRATAFREEPTEENMMALLEAAEKNLRKLMKTGKVGKTAKATKEAKPAAKTTKARKNKTVDNSAAIAKITKKIVSLREKRAESDNKAKRAKYLAQIRELKAERAELKAA